MPHPPELKQWIGEVSRQFPLLRKPEALVLALYSFGIVLTHQCGQTSVATFLALLLCCWPDAMRQRLREWNYEALQKRGKQRREICVEEHFGALLRWALQDDSGERELVLALDVTYLGARFTALVVSVLYRGCALPVAWHILPGNTAGEWHPVWLELLQTLQGVLPADWQVYVLTDRGLYSKRLFEALVAYGWHPLMRIRTNGRYRRLKNQTWGSLARVAQPSMGVWCQRVQCFKGDPLTGTLWVTWDARYAEPCLIITDLLPRQACAKALYAWRMWIEAGFKDLKSGGLHWEQTHMTDARRVARLWLVLAVALVWLMRVGGVVQVIWQRAGVCSGTLSCERIGWLTLLAGAVQRQPLPLGCFLPHDWHKAPSIINVSFG